MMKKHLFLALAKAGWGETILGLRIASELHAAGDVVHFMAHSSVGSLLHDVPFSVHEVPDHIGPLTKLYIEELLSSQAISSLILSDFCTTDLFFRLMGMSGEFLCDYGVPVIAMDIWDSQESGNEIDLFLEEVLPVPTWIARTALRLLPSPIVRPSNRRGVYSCLPAATTVPNRVREHIRADIGLTPADRAILFSTARWQQAAYTNEHALRLAAKLPLLLSHFVRRLGASTHLIHVGPAQYPLREVLGHRYHWIPSLPARQFDLLVGSMDLLVSANISATSIGKAITSGVPAVVLQNSIKAASLEETVASMPRRPSPDLVQWLREALPVYPFSLWPLGYRKYLEPVLADNPYTSCVQVCEILDEEHVLETCTGVLFDKALKSACVTRQAEYVERVNRLPKASDIVHDYLGDNT